MATLEQLNDALVKADAAGNVDDARAFAGEIRRMRDTQTTQPSQPSVMDDYGKPDPQTGLKQTLNESSWGGRNLAGIGSAAAKLYYGGKQLVKGGTLSPEDQQSVKDWSTIENEAPVGAIAGNLGAMYLGARAVSSIPSLAKVGTSLMLPKTAAQAIGAGAGYSALQPTTEQGAAGLQQRGTEALKGGLAAGLGYGAAKVLGRVLNPQTSPDIQLLQKEGIPTTLGQTLGGRAQVAESKLTSTPLLGDLIASNQSKGIDALNVAAYNRALSPIGEKASGKVGFAGVEEVHNKLSNAYQNLVSKMSFKPDQQFVSDVGNVRTLINELPKESQKLYDKLLTRLALSRVTPQGTMSGETLKSVESQIGKEVSSLRQSQSYEHGKIADALEEVVNSIRSNLARQDPKWAKQLSKANEGWANYSIIRDAATKASGRSGEAFTPANLAAAVSANAKKQAGQVVGKAKIGEGRALMQDLSSAAENRLAPAYPDSGTAGRMLPWALGAATGTGAVATGTALPLAAATGIASLPYLPGVNRLTNAILTKRPDLLRAAGGRLSELAPYGAALGIGSSQ